MSHNVSYVNNLIKRTASIMSNISTKKKPEVSNYIFPDCKTIFLAKIIENDIEYMFMKEFVFQRLWNASIISDGNEIKLTPIDDYFDWNIDDNSLSIHCVSKSTKESFLNKNWSILSEKPITDLNTKYFDEIVL